VSYFLRVFNESCLKSQWSLRPPQN
jgi:hypothetical protein